ncbi:DKNYY domain-containing protein [Pseudomonadota bacterium AL_CKDN230030165-1A_HGKHYDSX7]
MVERCDHPTPAGPVPVIPYDTFEAAQLFLATGRALDEVLTRLGLTPDEWTRLQAVYRHFPSGYGDTDRQRYFGELDDAAVYRMVLPPRWRVSPDDVFDLRATWHIREAVRRDPYIGPFAECGWPMTWIAAHPEASQLSYTHDGRTVYFGGAPLADRQGAPLAVDAASFAVVGGRWLRDATRIYGQGEAGARPKRYWYVVEGADLESFEALNLRYARDCRQAYYITGKTLRSKSPDAFEVVPELRLNYRDGTRDPLHDISVIARDREAVYFYGTRLKRALPATFQDLGHGFASDGEHVWYLEDKILIEGADAASFIVPGPGEPLVLGPASGHVATDRYRPYVRGQVCDAAVWFDAWRPWFEARPDLDGWWWHAVAAGRS